MRGVWTCFENELLRMEGLIVDAKSVLRLARGALEGLYC